jgi:DNA relaxase NicK
MRFDWYQASIPGASPEVVMAALSEFDYYGSWEQMRPLKNYDSAAAFVVGNETRFKIHFGGQNVEHGPNVVGSGASAQALADVIRTRFPAHRVSRVDSCEDYHHPDAYGYLRKAALKIAKQQRVQCREIVKPLPESDDGRTLYLGSQSSVVSMRIYEKGKQLGCEGEWVRAELQVRPQKDVKTIVAMLDSTEVWGLSKWSHSMAEQLGKKGLQRVDAQVYEQSDHDRAYRFMIKQYRRVLEQMLASHGSPEAVGAQIFYDLAHLDEAPPKASLKPFKEV